MTPKQRVYAAMQHIQPDRAPLFYRDVPEVEQRLCKDLGLADREALLRYLDIDFRWVEPEYVGPSLFDEEAGTRRSIWGVNYRYLKLEQGAYWEPVRFSLADQSDPAALEDYPWPSLDWYDFSDLGRQVAAYADYAIMTAPGEASPGVLVIMQDLLGMERALTESIVNRPFFDRLVEKIMEFRVPFIKKMVTACNGGLDFFRLGDDFGTQRSLLMSINQWRDAFAPPLYEMAKTAKECGARYYYHHTCGAIRPLIPDMIDIGVDVLDPLQIHAVGMDPAGLKADFGDKLVFSGGIDEQHVLPHGTPDEVRKEVRRICDIMAVGGGYFVGSTHNFQDDIPTANILAMYEAAREWKADRLF